MCPLADLLQSFCGSLEHGACCVLHAACPQPATFRHGLQADSLAYLTRLQNLKVLTLEEPASLFYVAALSHLKHLSKVVLVGNGEETQIDCMPLRALPHLEALHLLGVGFCRNLRHLGMWRLKLQDSFNDGTLQLLPDLQALQIDNGECAQYLSQLTCLTRVCLNMSDTRRWPAVQTAKALAALGALPRLERFTVNAHPAVQLSSLGLLTRLRCLSINHCSEATTGPLRALQALPLLSTLGLTDCQGAPVLPALPIQRLFMSYVYDSEPRVLPGLQACARLADIRLRVIGSTICLHEERMPAWPLRITVSIHKGCHSHILVELGFSPRISVQLVRRVSLNKDVVQLPG